MNASAELDVDSSIHRLLCIAPDALPRRADPSKRCPTQVERFGPLLVASLFGLGILLDPPDGRWQIDCPLVSAYIRVQGRSLLAFTDKALYNINCENGCSNPNGGTSFIDRPESLMKTVDSIEKSVKAEARPYIGQPLYRVPEDLVVPSALTIECDERL